MMPTPYDELVNIVAGSGIPEAEAALAINRCLRSMAMNAGSAYIGGGAVAYFLRMNPGTAMSFAAVSLGVGAAYGLAKSPSCSEVRQAIGYWTSQPL